MICGGQLNILKGHNSKWFYSKGLLFRSFYLQSQVIILNIFIPKDHSEDFYPEGSFRISE